MAGRTEGRKGKTRDGEEGGREGGMETAVWKMVIVVVKNEERSSTGSGRRRVDVGKIRVHTGKCHGSCDQNINHPGFQSIIQTHLPISQHPRPLILFQIT